MADIVNRINPADFELQSVQTNLANKIDSIAASSGSTSSKDQIRLKPLLEQVRGPGTASTIKTPALQIDGDPAQTGAPAIIIGTPPADGKSPIPANIQFWGNLVQIGGSSQTGPFNLFGNQTIIGNSALTGNQTITGSQTVTGNQTINGNTVLNPPATNGVIIQPGASGPAFYITNLARNSAMFILFDTGYLQSVSGATFSDTVQAPSFVSGQGFKQYIPLGSVYRNQQGTLTRSQELAVNGNNSSSSIVNQPMPFAGSIVGVTAALSAAVAAPQTVTIYKNNGGFIQFVIPANQLNTTVPPTFPKGQYPFIANDLLGAGTTSASTGTTLGIAQYPIVNCRIALIVEMGA